MPKKDSQVERLGEVLQKSLSRMELASRLDEYGVWPIWNDVVGKTVARNAQPEKIRNGTLFVKVSSPVWMQQLQFMKDLIGEKLNQRLRAPLVKNIFFVVGRIESGGGEADASPRQPAVKPAERQLDEGFLQTVRDPELKEAFKRLLKNYARRTRRA